MNGRVGSTCFIPEMCSARTTPSTRCYLVWKGGGGIFFSSGTAENERHIGLTYAYRDVSGGWGLDAVSHRWVPVMAVVFKKEVILGKGREHKL